MAVEVACGIFVSAVDGADVEIKYSKPRGSSRALFTGYPKSGIKTAAESVLSVSTTSFGDASTVAEHRLHDCDDSTNSPQDIVSYASPTTRSTVIICSYFRPGSSAAKS